MTRIVLVVGTRPQIIKSAPIISKLSGRRGFQFSLVHTGQHYDYELSKVFFNEMQLPNPDVNLEVGSDTSVRQTAAIMVALERVLVNLSPDIVLVPGDTNSALAAGLTAVKVGIPCFHLEAGPRSFDPSSQEEVNRTIVDHVAPVAFAPTPLSVTNLRNEGLSKSRVVYSGDTMLDSFLEHRGSLHNMDLSKTLGNTDVIEKDFVLVTIHRQENTENDARLRGIIRALKSISGTRFLFSVHPRTKRRLKELDLWRKLLSARNLEIAEPTDCETTLALASRAKTVLTDSGGLQKEALWLGTPCITVLETTPWPETLRYGANRCIRPEPDSVKRAISAAARVRVYAKRWYSYFGDGMASKRVVDVLAGKSKTSGRNV